MTIYYVVILVLTGLGYLYTDRKKSSRNTIVYLAAAFFILTALASFRYAIGFDYFSYQTIYLTVSEWSFQELLQTHWYEPLFFLVCKFFASLGCSFPLFLLIINAFLIFVALRFIYRYSKLPWLSVFFYITLQFLAYNMNLIRQSIALAFFLLAFPYLKDRKLLPYASLIILGGLFHNSLLFFLPFYFILPLKNTPKRTGWVIGLCLAVYLLFDPLFSLFLSFLPERYQYYQNSLFWSGNSFIYVIPSLVYCILIFWFREKLPQNQTERSIYLNSALCTLIISLFITKHFILERFSIYPFSLALIAIPEILCQCQTVLVSKKNPEKTCQIFYRTILILFISFGCAYFAFAASKGFHNVYPFVSLLQKARTTPH